MSIDEIKEKILLNARIVDLQQYKIEMLIQNDNVDDDTIRDAINDLKCLRETFHSRIDEITLEQWQEILKD